MGKVHILCVDDSTDILELYRYFLEDRGFICLTAMDYGEALGLFSSQKYLNTIPLAILDYKLREGTGYELRKELITITPNLKTILASGSDVPLDEKQVFSRFIQKPFSLFFLGETIKSIMGEPKHQQV